MRIHLIKTNHIAHNRFIKKKHTRTHTDTEIVYPGFHQSLVTTQTQDTVLNNNNNFCHSVETLYYKLAGCLSIYKWSETHFRTENICVGEKCWDFNELFEISFSLSIPFMAIEFANIANTHI